MTNLTNAQLLSSNIAHRTERNELNSLCEDIEDVLAIRASR